MSLKDRAILITLGISSFAPRKTDKRVTSEVLNQHGAGHDAGRWIKNLLPEAALRPIGELDSEIRRFHYQRTLPWTDDGRRILPTSAFDEYMTQMRAFRSAREARVKSFLDNYDRYVHEAKRILNGTFEQADYPDRYTAQRRFSFRLDSVPIPSETDFRVTLSDGDMDDLRQSVRSQVERAEQLARNDLLLRLSEPLTHMVNRLGDGSAVFRDSLVENLREIAALIPSLNVTGDPRIEALRAEITEKLCNFPAETLRTVEVIRGAVARDAQSILDKMSAWLPSDVPCEMEAAA